MAFPNTESAPAGTRPLDAASELTQRPAFIDASPWRRRFHTIYETLRERITLLHYPPGTRLDIDQLTVEFAVSRTPIRTVLQRLESEGLAITRHGVGTAVTAIDFEHVREATLLRMHLAELIGTLSPIQPDEAMLRSLSRLQLECSNMQYDDDAPYKFARIDMQLHDCKCRVIGNEPLRRTYDELYYRTVRMWFFFLPRMDLATEFAALSTDIAATEQALRRGDVKAMGFTTRNAISAGLFRLHHLLAEAESP